MKRLSIFFAALLVATMSFAENKTDKLTADKLVSGNAYADFSGKKFTSDAVYAGNVTTATGDNAGAIQMRSKQSNSGIVSTTSGGAIKSVSITVKSGTNVLNIYGSNTAYAGASDLYDKAKQGTLLGTLSATGKYTVEATNYAYVGVRSANGPIYLTDISFEWGEATVVDAEKIELNAASLNLAQYKYTTLTATLTPTTATTEVVWSSADETVATVENGKVTAVGIGTTEITATAGNVNAKCTVNVIAATPITVAEAVEIGQALGNGGVAAGGMYVIRGFVTALTGKTPAEQFNTYGNYSVYIDDTKGGKAAFEAYQVVPTDGKSIAEVGDSVEVIGDITKYNSTIETVEKTGTIRILKKATYTVTPLSNDADMGNVKGGGTFDRKDSATVFATAYTGFEFVAWVAENKTDTLSKEATYKFEVTQDAKVYAIFKAEQPLTPATWYGQAPLTGTLTGSYVVSGISGTVDVNVDYSIVYEITRTALRYLTVKLEINDEAAALTGFGSNLFIDEIYSGAFKKDDSGIYSYTTTKKYTDGEVLKIKFQIFYRGGSTYADEISYTVGSSNNKPTAIEKVSNNDTKATKRIVNGVLVIEKNGVRYNAQGVVME